MGRVYALGFAAAMLCAASCDDGSSESDAGSSGEDAGIPEADAALLESASITLGYAVALTAPLVDDAERVRDADGPVVGADRQAMTRNAVEDGVATNSVVTDEACVGFAWDGLTATITFTNCVLEETGEPLNGSVTLGVAFHPTVFTLSFSGLSSGTRSMDGSLTLNVGGSCSSDDPSCMACGDMDVTCSRERMPQQTLTGNLTVAEQGSTTFSIDSLTIRVGGATTEVSGTLSTPESTVTASTVTWNIGECLPSSGSLALDSGASITFQDDTPQTGTVLVQIPPLPAFPQTLFEPC